MVDINRNCIIGFDLAEGPDVCVSNGKKVGELYEIRHPNYEFRRCKDGTRTGEYAIGEKLSETDEYVVLRLLNNGKHVCLDKNRYMLKRVEE